MACKSCKSTGSLLPGLGFKVVVRDYKPRPTGLKGSIQELLSVLITILYQISYTNQGTFTLRCKSTPLQPLKVNMFCFQEGGNRRTTKSKRSKETYCNRASTPSGTSPQTGRFHYLSPAKSGRASTFRGRNPR